MGKMTVAEAMLRDLAQSGVEVVFGYPGSTNLALFDAFSRVDSVRLILVRHEQGAAHMADGYVRACGKPAACSVSRGPGASNLISGLHTAYQESVPIVALVGQVDSDILYRDAFEEMDLVTLFRPVTKYAVEVSRATRVREVLKRALHYATSGRPRPVMVSVPGDIQKEVVERQSEDFIPRATVHPPFPSLEELAKAREMLTNARHPLFLVGGGTKSSQAVPEVVRLAELIGAGVVVAWMRNDAFPNDHTHYLGMVGTGHRSAEATKQALNGADVVLAVGCRFSENTTNRYTMSFDRASLIHIDIDPVEIGKIYQPQLGICADAKQTLTALIADFEARGPAQKFDRAARMNWVGKLRESYVPVTKLPSAFLSGKMHAGEIVRAMKALLPPETIIVSDSGAFIYFVLRYYSFNVPGTLIAPAGGTMGFGLPAAIGAKLAKPETPVVCVSGDGGFLMTLQEIETAVRYGLNVVSIVFNNGGLGNIIAKQRKQYEGRLMGSRFGNPDFCKLAESFGAHGEHVTHPDQMAPALRKALQANRPAVIDVHVDPDVILP